MDIVIGIGVAVLVVAYIGFLVWLVSRNMQASFLMLSSLRLAFGVIISLSLGFGLLPAAAGLPLGILLAAGLWYGGAFLRSRFGKWSTLARRYSREGDFPPGRQWRFRTAMLGSNGPQGLGHPLIALQSWLVMGTDEGGLYLSHHLIGRPFHPALYIPWDGITVTPPEHVFGWFKRFYVDLNIGTERIVLRLDRKFATRLLEQHGPAVPPVVMESKARPTGAGVVRA